ncbi:MAG: DoxX family protein [Chloroflexota bacterium]|nr:DoxX family protein [Chloroflexota bacterium]
MAILSVDRRVTGILWLALRLWLGYTWLKAGLPKVVGDKAEVWVGDKAGAAVSGFLKGALARAEGDNPQVQSWYADFVRDVAIPNASLFSYLVAYGEVLVGVALILGLFTHFAASMGLVMNLAYLFAGTISKNPQMLMAEAAIVSAGITAGYYGVDRYLIPYLGERLGLGGNQERVGDRSRSSSTVGAA